MASTKRRCCCDKGDCWILIERQFNCETETWGPQTIIEKQCGEPTTGEPLEEWFDPSVDGVGCFAYYWHNLGICSDCDDVEIPSPTSIDVGTPTGIDTTICCSYVYSACPCGGQHDCGYFGFSVPVSDFPNGPGVYMYPGGGCVVITGPPVLGTPTVPSLPTTGQMPDCESCNEACNCGFPTQTLLSLTGWSTNTQAGSDISSFGSRYWYQIAVTNPMTGSYTVPFTGGAGTVLATFTNAVIATGPYGEFGRNDLELVYGGSALGRCVDRELPSLRHRWRIQTSVYPRVTNITTTDPEAVIGPGFPRTFAGHLPFGVVWTVDQRVPCNEGAEYCETPNTTPYGPDGGCAAWQNWPGCPTTPTTYMPHQTGCIKSTPL